MRVTQSMMYETTTTALSQAMTNLNKVSEQVSSTKRLNHPSDDPADVRSAVKVREALAQLNQFTRNVEAATRWVSSADTALGNAGDLMQRANELAVEGANGSLGTDERQAMSKEIEQLAAALVQDASTKAGDQYIFSGFRVDRAPYVMTGAATVGAYQGDTGPLLTKIGPDSAIQVNVTADSAFQPAFDALAQLHADLAAGGTVQGSTITQINAALQSLIDARAITGARANRLDDAKTSQDTLIQDSTKFQSELEDVDMTQAITELSQRQLTYDAALKVNARVMQNSLIDYLR